MDSEFDLHPMPKLPSTNSSLPEISIPREWLLSPSLSDPGLSMVKPRQQPCPICAWDGTLETLFHFNNFAHTNLWHLKPSECVSCPFLSIACYGILKKISEGQTDGPWPDASGVIIWVSSFITTSNQHMPGQRAITITRAPPIPYPGPTRVGFYVFIPAGQYREEPPYGLPTKRILRGSISSASSASWARRRLESCLSAHVKCSSSQNRSFLPTRLVDVRPLGPEGNVKLIQGLNLPNGT